MNAQPHAMILVVKLQSTTVPDTAISNQPHYQYIESMELSENGSTVRRRKNMPAEKCGEVADISSRSLDIVCQALSPIKWLSRFPWKTAF